MNGQLDINKEVTEENRILDNDFLLNDRIKKIKQVIGKYGQDSFYIGFSGGRDSTVVSYLVDLALPNNKIPRVFADTGIELNITKEFVYECKEKDDRVVIIKPSVPIKTMLEEYGYPFKNKFHSKQVDVYQRNGRGQATENYLGTEMKDKTWYRKCPQKLAYQFSEDFKLKVSNKCCYFMKEKPLNEWSKDHNRPYGISGIMRTEEGNRWKSDCLIYKDGRFKMFQPLAPMEDAWEQWFIDKFEIQLSKAYYPPYNLVRSGCRGCPYSLHLQEELDMLAEFFPNERKACEIIWKPVYDEYRRIGFRLKPIETEGQLNFFEDYLC